MGNVEYLREKEIWDITQRKMKVTACLIWTSSWCSTASLGRGLSWFFWQFLSSAIQGTPKRDQLWPSQVQKLMKEAKRWQKRVNVWSAKVKSIIQSSTVKIVTFAARDSVTTVNGWENVLEKGTGCYGWDMFWGWLWGWRLWQWRSYSDGLDDHIHLY